MRYLFTNGNTIYTTETTSSSGTNAYYSRVWRLISKDNMYGRELNDQTEFHKAVVMLESTTTVKFRESPDNAIWSSASDFTYSNYDTSVVSIDASTGVLTPFTQGTTDVQCVHKVTLKRFTFSIQVVPKLYSKGTLSYWNNSEDDAIGYWTSSPTIFSQKLNSNTEFDFAGGYSVAVSSWQNALNIALFETTESEADIKMYGGTKSELMKKGFPNQSGLTGLTTYADQIPLTGYYTYGNSIKIEAHLIQANVYIVYSSLSYSDAKIKNTCTHELGHALGYFGHSDTPSDVMYYRVHSDYTLKPNEINHLKQMYDKYLGG